MRNGIEHDPKPQPVLHLYLHQAVVFTIGIVPRQSGLARREHLLPELRWSLLRGSGGYEVVLAVVAQARIDAGIVASGFGEAAILVEPGGVALTVPIIIAFYAVIVVQHRADAFQCLSVLALGDTACEGTVAVPRSAPHPFRNPYRAARRVGPVPDRAEVSLWPIAMEVDDVASPAAGVDAVDEAFDVT